MQVLYKFFVGTLLSATFLTPTHAQTTPFLGTWEATANGETFRIILTNNPSYRGPDGKIYDVILGKHTYRRGTTVVEESLTAKESPLFGVPTTDGILHLAYQDLTLKKRGRVTLTLLPNNQLHWQLGSSAETIRINSHTPEKAGFTVPNDLTLTRVN